MSSLRGARNVYFLERIYFSYFHFVLRASNFLVFRFGFCVKFFSHPFHILDVLTSLFPHFPSFFEIERLTCDLKSDNRDVIETFPIPLEVRSENVVGAAAIRIWWMQFPHYLRKVCEVGASWIEIQIDRRHQRLFFFFNLRVFVKD